jgi:hypothetical protein
MASLMIPLAVQRARKFSRSCRIVCNRPICSSASRIFSRAAPRTDSQYADRLPNDWVCKRLSSARVTAVSRWVCRSWVRTFFVQQCFNLSGPGVALLSQVGVFHKADHRLYTMV